uniref:hypothetical protein n=1 Tax=Azoarcus taiwanensis TaxID=666964 RepID=UPI001B7CEA82
VMLVGEQVGLDGGAFLHGWRQRTKSGQSNFTNHRGAEVFRGALKSVPVPAPGTKLEYRIGRVVM